MAFEQIKLLVQFFYSPKKAASGVLDHGSFAFALICSLLVAAAVSVGALKSEADAYPKLVEKYLAEYKASPPALPPQIQDMEIDAEDPAAALPRDGVDPRLRVIASRRASREIGRLYFGSSWRSLAMIAVLFVPACLILGAIWAHLGSATTVLFRDYMPLLVNCLFAWTASHLPVAILWYTGLLTSPLAIQASQLAGSLGFLVLSAFCMESVLGVGFGQAFGLAVAGVGASMAGGMLFSMSGSLMYFFLSPWVLFYLYRMFGGDVRALGDGLASRQNFKRQLEAATLNPHDADAHFQLGLIYLQRRNKEDAEKSFRRALEIDPDEETALYELGRMQREAGNLDEAQKLLARGAKLNDRLSNHEVWRELGAISLAAGRQAEALTMLEKYVGRREYDPEGLVLFGKALKQAGRAGEARSAFEQAIAAVKSAPAFRRHELKKFEREAEIEIRTV